MSYLDRKESARTRFGSAAAVIAAEAAVGVALVTGLAINITAPKPVPNPDAINVTVPLDPPPPDPKPTEAPANSVITAPLPPFPLPPIPGPIVELPQPIPTDVALVPVPIPSPTFAPLPTPAPSYTPRSASPLNGPRGWVVTDDYPAGPLRRGVEGQAGYRLAVGSDGRVSACEITQTSGNAELDQATCRYITRRARFEPATDARGAKAVGSYTGTVKWQIPD